MGAQQGHISPRSADAALVQDLARTVAAELVLARHEIAVGNIECRGDQTGRIDGSALAKQDTVGVDDEHLAIGRQVAEDARPLGAQHPIQGHGAGIGLLENHRLAATDIERVPVNHSLLTALLDNG